jgi:hypothetical protein
MKKRNYLLSTLIVLLMVGCGKYEEGPGVSLRSKTKRLSGLWVRYDIMINNEPALNLYQLDMTFDKDGGYQSNNTQGSGVIVSTNTGTWEFADSKAAIKFSTTSSVAGNDSVVVEQWDIERLKNDDLWVGFANASATYTMKFRKLQ